MDTHPIALSPETTAFSMPTGLVSVYLLLLGWWYAHSSTPKTTSIVVLQIILLGAWATWSGLVSAVVPEPYLDEVFHIPQAQKYCAGRFRDWDDKITTPPGLYLVSVLVPRVLDLASLEGLLCDARSLRATNAISLLVLGYVCLLCRQKVVSQLRKGGSATEVQARTPFEGHTAINIALFPLLFFFSGLYYTDVVSTTTVVLAFLHHLSRVEQQSNSILSDIMVIFLGLATLLMRQTNVFWVVVFMGGLEAVHAVKSLRPNAVARTSDASLLSQVQYSISRYASGAVHDPPLSQAWPDDALFTILSLVIGAVCNPVPVLRKIWPYVTVLTAFAGFVVWNGSVVLGDKANHVATIHFAQMLYIWPFFAFFSWPLLLPGVLSTLGSLAEVLLGKSTEPSHASSKPSLTKTSGNMPKSSYRFDLGIIVRLIVWVLYTLATALCSVAIVKYNTIIHPFTLADNRHYMFYVFRYTIRRAEWIRYALVLPYTVSRWLVWATFAGTRAKDFGAISPWNNEAEEGLFNNYPVWNTPRAATTKAQVPAQKKHQSDAPIHETEPVSTSTGLIFLLATALSLVTAPLVEPRYFIIPWVMWRLLLPAWPPKTAVGQGRDKKSQTSVGGRIDTLFQLLASQRIALSVETVWFITINAVTGYIFLTKPYQWKATDGSLLDDGRWQRFMW